jgi:general secretion pathway protein G
MRALQGRNQRRGFTLIEMIIVIAIIGILIATAVPIYKQHLLHAHEAVLKEDLYTMRNAIDQFTQDKNKAPQSLDDLVQAGYMRAIPKDPFTNSNSSWQTVQEDVMTAIDQTQPGITDVKSGSSQTGSDGTPYNTW